MKKICRKIPKLIPWLAIFISVLLLGKASGLIRIYPPVEETALISEREIVEEINLARTTSNLVVLKIHPLLERSAQLKANDIAKQKYFSHNTSDGRETWVFFKEAGYKYTYAGENLARYFLTAKGVVGGWLGSQSHRRIILDPRYREIGIGQTTWDENTIIVAHFGKR